MMRSFRIRSDGSWLVQLPMGPPSSFVITRQDERVVSGGGAVGPRADAGGGDAGGGVVAAGGWLTRVPASLSSRRLHDVPRDLGCSAQLG